MSFLSEYMSIGGFARYHAVTERTVRTWIGEESVLSEGMIRRNNTIFIGTGAINEFEDKYLFGNNLLDEE